MQKSVQNLEIKQNKLIKIFITLLVLFFLLTIGIIKTSFAQFTLWEIQNFQVVPSEIAQIGEIVSVSFDLYGSPLAVDIQNNVHPSVNFGDGNSQSGEECSGNPLAQSPKKCHYSFLHIYTNPGTYTISVSVNMPGSTFTGGSSVEVMTHTIIIREPTPPQPSPGGNPLVATSVEEIFSSLANFIYWVGSGVLLAMLVFGGLMILTSGGNPQNISRGKKAIFYSLIGFAIMSLARGIIQLIFIFIQRR